MPTCDDLEMLGAWVTYYINGEFASEELIEADSAEKVEQESAQTAGKFEGMTYEVGYFGCQAAPSEEIPL